MVMTSLAATISMGRPAVSCLASSERNGAGVTDEHDAHAVLACG